MASAPAVLTVQDLAVTFQTDGGPVPAVRGVSLEVRAGETLALVGESGSGKSVTSLAIMRLTPAPPRARITGRVMLTRADGTTLDLLALPEPQMRALRGEAISMIFQEPMTSLNPVHKVGRQITEALRYHRDLDRRAATRRATELLELVGIPEPAKRLDAYPHHLSGGMRQRVMIAMALACDPQVLIADEPTTALDVTVQAQILDLLQDLQQRTGMAVLFITHNLGVVAEIADRVMVMYAGRIVEAGGVVPVLKEPLMPYTQGLLRSVPRLDWSLDRHHDLAFIPGSVPDPHLMPPGCAFEPRCGHADPPRCRSALPGLEAAGDGHLVRCCRWQELARP
ncbi:MAG: ABC transporter ATP-binding protein [Geminicoccaceae bacterium]